METLPVPTPPAPVPSKGKAWPMTRESVEAVCQNFTPAQREALLWGYDHALSSGLSLGSFAELLRKPGTNETYSYGSAYQVYAGNRGGDNAAGIDRFVSAIITLRQGLGETEARRGFDFVRWEVSDAIWRVCAQAWKRQRLSYIFGPSQCGKTAALSAFRKEAAAAGKRCWHVRVPTRGGMLDTLEELAFRVGVNYHGSGRGMKRAILSTVRETDLVIIDEAHQCLSSARGVWTLEFFREIWDRRRCGMVICATDALATELKTHPTLAQIWKRKYRTLWVGHTIEETEAAKFARAFGLTPADNEPIRVPFPPGSTPESIVVNPLELQASVLRTEGLGPWLQILEDARDLAEERAKKLSWAHVAVAQFQAGE